MVNLIGTPDPTAPAACPPQTAPTCLDIGGPLRRIGSARADAAGTARITIALPPTAQGTVAGQAISRGEVSQRFDATFADTDPTQVSLDACALDETVAPRVTDVVELFGHVVELFGPNTAGPFFPTQFGPAQATIHDDVAYQAFQADNGMTLPPVDFTQYDVLASVHAVSSTCGLWTEGYDVWVHPGTGEPILKATFHDSSRNCFVACAALGFDAVVVQVPKSGAPQVCTDFVGGCP
jgi:hypothetical protein